MASKTFDRSQEDVGNIVGLEHVNVRVPDQVTATIFYVMGLGFTRDPYLNPGVDNMWINLGRSQFHLPTSTPQVLRGVVGLVVADFDALQGRLAEVKNRLGGTKFDYKTQNGHIEVTCPWGNRMRCHAPGPEFRDMTLGMPYVDFTVPRGTAAGIARFYDTIMGAPSTVTTESGGAVAHVRVGAAQEFIFRETSAAIPAYDGHHVAVYVSDFGGPHGKLVERGLVTEESNPYQYRFKTIADPDSGQPLFEIEHEVRSVTHPMFLRPLVNRNPAQRQRTYVRGADAFFPPGGNGA